MAELTARDRELLEFAGLRWRQPGAKEQAIRDRFGMTSVRYHQLLNTLIDTPAACEQAPVLVGRLRRQRATAIRRRGR